MLRIVQDGCVPTLETDAKEELFERSLWRRRRRRRSAPLAMDSKSVLHGVLSFFLTFFGVGNSFFAYSIIAKNAHQQFLQISVETHIETRFCRAVSFEETDSRYAKPVKSSASWVVCITHHSSNRYGHRSFCSHGF